LAQVPFLGSFLVYFAKSRPKFSRYGIEKSVRFTSNIMRWCVAVSVIAVAWVGTEGDMQFFFKGYRASLGTPVVLYWC
jgi:hypothetical protein